MVVLYERRRDPGSGSERFPERLEEETAVVAVDLRLEDDDAWQRSRNDVQCVAPSITFRREESRSLSWTGSTLEAPPVDIRSPLRIESRLEGLRTGTLQNRHLDELDASRRSAHEVEGLPGDRRFQDGFETASFLDNRLAMTSAGTDFLPIWDRKLNK